MLIQLYNYDMSATEGVIHPLECTVTNRVNDVPTAEIKCLVAGSENVLLGQKMWIETGWGQDIFIIMDVSIDDTYLTIQCEGLCSQASRVVCYYAHEKFQSETEHPFSLWDYLYSISCSLAAVPTVGYFKWTDRRVISSYYNIMILYKDDDNVFRFSDALHLPSSSSVLWNQFAYDANGKTLKEIIDDFVDKTGINVIYIGKYIFLTEYSFYELVTNFQSSFPYASSVFRFKTLTSNKQIFSRQMSTSYNITQQESKICAALMPLFTMEVNDRSQELTKTQYLTNNISASEPTQEVIYNTFFREDWGWSEAECRRYIESYNAKHEIVWNRYLSFAPTIYNSTGTNPTDIRWDMLMTFDKLISSTVSQSVPIYDIYKQQLAVWEVKYSELETWVYLTDEEGSYLGQAICYLNDSSKKQYQLSLVIDYLHYKARCATASSQIEASLLALTSPINKPSDVSLYTPFGKELGHMDVSQWNEDVVSTKEYGIFVEVEQETGTSTTEQVVGEKKVGYSKVQCKQTWDSYWTILHGQIAKLSQTYVDSWIPDMDAQNVSVSLNLKNYDKPICVSDYLTIWIGGNFNNAAEYVCSQTKYDAINGYYLDLEIGYRKSVLKQLNQNQIKMQRELSWK